MSYSTMEKLQYSGSRAQESRQPASTCSVRVGQCVHTYLHACVLRMCTAVYRASVRFCLTNFPAAHSVRSLPRLRGRGREGACNKVEGACDKVEGACNKVEGACNKVDTACKKIHVRTLTPSPSLPRKRGREQTGFAARADSTLHEHALTPCPSVFRGAERRKVGPGSC